MTRGHIQSTGASGPGAAPRRGLARAAYDILASGRLAVWLLAALAALLLLYLFIPQFGPADSGLEEAWVAENGLSANLLRILGLTDVRRSPWLQAAFALLFINLLLCMVRRFPPVSRSWTVPDRPPSDRPGWSGREIDRLPLGVEDLAGFFRRKRYRVRVAEGTVYGLRGRLNLVGHWVFHVGLLGLIAAGAWLALAPTAFRGAVGIGEGEEFDLHRTPFLGANIPLDPDLPPLRFRLDRVEVETVADEVRRFEAELTTPEGKSARMAINRPYRRRPYQLRVHGFGHMPGWVVVAPGGRMVAGAWVKAVPFPSLEEDSFPFGPGDGVVTFRYRPDRAKEPFEARVVYQGEPLHEGPLAPEQRVPLGNGLEFFFLPEVRRYVLVDVIQERGVGLLFAWFGIIVLGIGLRYARTRKEIVGEISGDRVRIAGRSEHLHGLFEEEMDRLARDLEEWGRPRAAREEQS